MANSQFLVLTTRTDDATVAQELDSLAKLGGLPPEQMAHFRLESAPLPELDIRQYRGVILGGSPFNASTPRAQRSQIQLRVESDLRRVVEQVTAYDHPFLGLCYGVGVMTTFHRGVIDSTYAEPAGPSQIILSDDGAADPLLADLPREFTALVGHKEAVKKAPDNAVILATSPACPVQMMRFGKNQYVTQFHPELEVETLAARLKVYWNAGYFPPGQYEVIMDACRAADISPSHRVLKNFITRFSQ